MTVRYLFAADETISLGMLFLFVPGVTRLNDEPVSEIIRLVEYFSCPLTWAAPSEEKKRGKVLSKVSNTVLHSHTTLHGSLQSPTGKDAKMMPIRF